jgi:hypothetical protein
LWWTINMMIKIMFTYLPLHSAEGATVYKYFRVKAYVKLHKQEIKRWRLQSEGPHSHHSYGVSIPPLHIIVLTIRKITIPINIYILFSSSKPYTFLKIKSTCCRVKQPHFILFCSSAAWEGLISSQAQISSLFIN